MTEELIRVRYGETDQMGHAYYANYLYWFEQARGRWCRDRGFTYKDMELAGTFLPVVEVGIKYRGEILYDDEIVVRLWVSEIKRASLKFSYQIRRVGEDRILTEGFSWHVTMSTARRAVTIPIELRELAEADMAVASPDEASPTKSS